MEYSSVFCNTASEYPLVDMTHLQWATRVSGTGTDGTYLKAKEDTQYYKMSLYSGNAVIGHESLNEVVVSRLLSALGIAHVEYNLVNALVQVNEIIFQTPICCSKEFKQLGESSTSLEYDALFSSLSPEEYARSIDSVYIDTMLLVDFVIINRDRHGANIEILTGETGKRFTPLFDHGFSFVAPLQNDIASIKSFDALRNVQANNYIGSQSLLQNLQLIRKPVAIHQLSDASLADIFLGLDQFFTPVHINKLKEIIVRRLEYVDSKNLCTYA